MKPLKTKAAILRAYKAGKEIQARDTKDVEKTWIRSAVNEMGEEGLWMERFEYRIKPEPPVYKTYQGWKRKIKHLWPDVVFQGDKDICYAVNKPELAINVIGYGEWDGQTGTLYEKEWEKQTALLEARKEINLYA